MKNRRQFVHLSLATLSISAFQPLYAQRSESQVFSRANLDAYDHGGLTEAIFEKHVGSLFTTYLDTKRAVYLRLEKVNHVVAKTVPDQPGKSVAPVRSSVAVTAFSLIFDTNGLEIPQDSYLVDHGVLGHFTMFLVPGLALSGKKTCIAYFNSFKQA